MCGAPLVLHVFSPRVSFEREFTGVGYEGGGVRAL